MSDASPPPPAQQQQTDHDTILFGSMPFTVFAKLGDRIDAALEAGVSSLPLLPKKQGTAEEGGDEKLMKMLCKSYQRNVDIAESFAYRNVFSIGNLAPTRRNNIVKAFLDDKDFPHSTMENDEESKMSSSSSSYRYPTKQDIPTPQEIQDTQNENMELLQKLRELRRRRNKLVTKLEKLSNADESTKTASRALQDSTNAQQVHESVTAVIMGKEGLDKLMREGAELSEKLDQEKRRRPEAEDDVVVEQPKKKLTLQEKYQEQKKLIKTTPEGIKEFNELLKER